MAMLNNQMVPATNGDVHQINNILHLANGITGVQLCYILSKFE